jgi:integrase
MASVRERKGKKGISYLGLYRDAEGKQKSAGTYATKKEALREARIAEAHGFAKGKTQYPYAVKVRGKLTVAAFADEWLPSHPIVAHTRYVYEQMLRVHILPVLGHRALTDVAAADVRQLFRAMEAKGSSKALLAKVKTVLSAMFQVAAEDGRIPYNFVRGVRYQAVQPKRRRALTKDEWLRVRRYLTGDDRLLADIQMTTGARIEEIMGMETADIVDGEWYVQRVRTEVDGEYATKDQTKTGKDRWVQMDPAVVDRIMERGPGRVFEDSSHHTRRLHWRNACRNAGLDWYPAPRDLRRTFATIARQGGADLEDVRVALGHTRIATTDGYLGLREETRGNALAAVQRMGAA